MILLNILKAVAMLKNPLKAIGRIALKTSILYWIKTTWNTARDWVRSKIQTKAAKDLEEKKTEELLFSSHFFERFLIFCISADYKR